MVIKSQAPRHKKDDPFLGRLFYDEIVGAGAAFESAVPDYEPDELPHTLPCHKMERMSV